jgi:hypothetical protein
VRDGQFLIPVEPARRDGRLGDAIASVAGHDEPDRIAGKWGYPYQPKLLYASGISSLALIFTTFCLWVRMTQQSGE